MTVESECELTKREGQDSPLDQLCYKVFLFPTADWAGKG